MATRAEIIAQTKSDLNELGAGISSTDAAGQNNLFFYALNNAASRMQIPSTDAYLATVDNNTVRILTLGTQLYVTKAIVKKMISIPRISSDQVSRDTFARVMELVRLLKEEFQDALSGSDIPRENSNYAEQVVTWAGGADGAGERSVEGNNFQRNSNDFYIDELGRDLTNYNNDGE